MRFLLATLLFGLSSPFVTFAQVTEQTSAVYFDTDEYQLTPEARAELELLAQDLLVRPSYSLRIDAHTDDRGTVTYNQELARNRANSVATFMKQKGVDVSRIQVLSHGELDPRFDNADEDGRQGNRRVDLVYEYSTLTDIDDLLSRISQAKKEVFTIDPTTNTRIIGEQGTSVWIPANSLTLPDGTLPSGTIQVELEESYDIFDMITEGLMTHSGNQVLETGGMISVQAYADGQALELSGDQELTLALPGTMQQPGMELFTAQTDQQGNVTDWTPTQVPFKNRLEDLVEMPPRPKMERHFFIDPVFPDEWSGMPVAPTKPVEPREPREVKRNSVRYNPGFFTRIFLGKKKIMEREEEMYSQKLEDYEERVDLHHQKMEVYQQAMETYKQKQAAQKIAMEAWLDQRATDSLQYEPGGDIYEAKLAAYKADHERILVEHQEQLDIWREVKRRKLAAFEEDYDLAGNYNPSIVYQYFTQINELGWINCDRFYEVPQEDKMELAIEDLDPEDERIFVVFEEINSILRAYKKEGQYKTALVPKLANIKIIGIKVVEGKAYLAELQTYVGANDYQLEYRPCSLAEMAKALEQTNRPG